MLLDWFVYHWNGLFHYIGVGRAVVVVLLFAVLFNLSEIKYVITKHKKVGKENG